MTAIEAELSFSSYNNDISTYSFDCRRGEYKIETKNNDVYMTQKFYVHRRLRNIIVTEIRVELLNRIPAIVDLFNVTKLLLRALNFIRIVFKN